LTVLASSFVIIPPGDQDVDFKADVVLAIAGGVARCRNGDLRGGARTSRHRHVRRRQGGLKPRLLFDGVSSAEAAVEESAKEVPRPAQRAP
jgi:hypothetical protein